MHLSCSFIRCESVIATLVSLEVIVLKARLKGTQSWTLPVMISAISFKLTA